MTARIVMDAGGGPVIGSITLVGADVSTPVLLSNADDTNVEGWRWEVLDAPPESPLNYPLPAATFSDTREITPDVKGFTIMVRLTTYRDAGRTVIDDTDQKVIRVRFEPPFDWVIPAAQESIEANELRGWAQDVNRILSDVHTLIEGGGGGGGSASFKSAVRMATTGALPEYVRVGNVITADDPGVLGDQDGVTPVEGDSILLLHGEDREDNGIYEITQLGDGGTPFILTRRDDADSDADVTSGMMVLVEEGESHRGVAYTLVEPNPITLNTSGLFFESVSGAVRGTQWWDGSSTDAGALNLGSSEAHDGDFDAVWDRINMWVGGFVMTATLPVATTDDHNRIVAFMEVAGLEQGVLTVTGDSINYGPNTGVGIMNLYGPGSLHVLRYDAGLGKFRLVHGAEALSTRDLTSKTGGLRPWQPGPETGNFDASPGFLYMWDGASGDATVTLPSLDFTKSGFAVGFVNVAPSGVLTLDPGSETILTPLGPVAGPVKLLAPYFYIVFRWTGSAWAVADSGMSAVIGGFAEDNGAVLVEVGVPEAGHVYRSMDEGQLLGRLHKGFEVIGPIDSFLVRPLVNKTLVDITFGQAMACFTDNESAVLAQADSYANAKDYVGVASTVASPFPADETALAQYAGVALIPFTLQDGSAWAVKDIIYLSPSVGGRLTNIPPSSVGQVVLSIGKVIFAAIGAEALVLLAKGEPVEIVSDIVV